MLTPAGFELAPSGYRSAALPVELSSPQGLEASFIQFKCTRYSRDNLTLIHERMCSVSILFQNHPQRYTWTEIFYDSGGPVSQRCEFKSRSNQHFSVDFCGVKLSWKVSVHVRYISEDDSEIESNEYLPVNSQQNLTWQKKHWPVPTGSYRFTLGLLAVTTL